MKHASGQRWAVGGGGMLGMTLAHRLAERGQRVTLFEAADHLGGLADMWKLGDVVWDRHYHVILHSDRYLRGLLSDLGLEREIEWVETKTGFYTGERLYSMSNTWEFLRFPPLRLWDKFRLGLTIFRASKVKKWQALERIPVVDWLRRWSGRRTLEKIWLPLLRAKLGENYQKASAAFIWATIARMYAARRSGLKKEMFGYVPGGYARILDRFSQQLVEDGVDIRLGQAVIGVTPDPDGGVTVEPHGAPAEHFDRVVLTVPAPVIARACPGLSQDEKERLQGIRYQGIVCASALLERPLADYYVTNITEPWVPFTAVIEMTALVDRRQFGGRTLVYLPKYVPAKDAAFDVPDEEIEAEFLNALARMYSDFRREHVRAFRVSRVRNVMAVPTLNYSQRLPPMETSLAGVYAVTSAHIVNSTLNVNETVRLAERAIETVLLPRTGPDSNSTTDSGKDASADRQLVA